MSYLGNSPGVASQRIVTTFTATAGQTTFTPSSGYALGYCDVFLNGVKLVNGDDYTASNGTTVVLASGASAGDSVEVVAFIPRGLSDGYTKSEADALLGQKFDKSGGTLTGILNAPRINLNGAPNGEICENSGRYSSRHSSYPSYLYKDDSGATHAEVYYGIGGKDLTLINYQANGVNRSVVGGVEGWKQDSAGRITMPNQPSFMARITFDGEIASGADINFDSIEFNRGSHFGASGNRRFVAPVEGVYQFTFGWHEEEYYGDWGNYRATIRKNGVDYMTYRDNPGAGGSSETVGNMTIVTYLAVGDYVTCAITAFNDTTPALENYDNYFCGFFIG